VALAFAACVNDLTLDLGFEAKETGGGAIWSWMVLEVVVAVTAEPERVVAGFEAGRVVTALGRGGAREMSNVLLLEPEEDKEGRKEALLFLSLALLVSNQSESDFFSLWCINIHLHIRRGSWNRNRTIDSPHGLHKSGSIRLR